MPWGRGEVGCSHLGHQDSLSSTMPGTWCLHLGGMPGSTVIQGQDAEGIEHPWVQAPQLPVPTLWLNVTSCSLPSPSSWARDTGPLLHQKASQVAGTLDGPLQLHLPPVPPVGQAADGDVGRNRVPWRAERAGMAGQAPCVCNGTHPDSSHGKAACSVEKPESSSIK